VAKFEAGHEKVGGKKKGTPNKTTKELKSVINMIVSGQIEKVDATFNALQATDPDKYLNLLFKLMEFVVAKKKDITSDDEPIKQPINIHVTDPRIGQELKKMLE